MIRATRLPLNKVDPMIRLVGIKKEYNVPVLKNINLEISCGDFISISGPSGSGKSTLMNILGLIEQPSGGEYYYRGEKLNLAKDHSNLRLEGIGFVFQSYNLIPEMTSEENILLPLLYAKKSRVKLKPLVRELQIGSLMSKRVNVLSGGEKQRVAIARALLLDPPLIIADEPTGNLDKKNRDIVLKILFRQLELGRSVLIISHDPYISSLAKQRYVLSQGELHEK